MENKFSNMLTSIGIPIHKFEEIEKTIKSTVGTNIGKASIELSHYDNCNYSLDHGACDCGLIANVKVKHY